MFGQLLKLKRGKWALVLLIVAVLGAVGSITQKTWEALPGVLILLAVAAVLVVTGIKAIKNPPPAPTLEDIGIHVTQEAIDAFYRYGKLPKVENSPVILTDGEQPVYACRAERIETKNRRLSTTGSGAGASIHVAKGINLRTGGGGSQSIYGDVEMIHEGELVITTGRIVFVANSRAFAEDLSKISAVSIDKGCLAIMAGKDNYSLRMPVPEYPCEIIKYCIKQL